MKTRTTWRLVSVLSASTLLTLSTSIAATGADAKVTDAKDGFSLTLPPKWTVIPLTGSLSKTFLAKATHNSASLEKSIKSEVKSAAADGIKVFGIGPAAKNFAANLNVGVESSSGAPTGAAFFRAVKSQEKSQLAQAGISDVHISTTTLPFAKVVEVSYALPKSVAGVPASGLQVVFEHTTHVYFLTITSLTAAADTTTLNPIASSWTWL
jgi:hypothetical protein